jgi:endonuclease/exonuclease/phosphatase (EEP) superfamily protein YafD
MKGMSTVVTARDVIVPCEAKGHKVRLAGGLRFWAGARCPVCRSRVDPKRYRRVLRWVANLKAPASSARGPRVAWWTTVVYLAFAIVSAAALWWLSDRWWLATVLLFGPRWVLLLPLLLIAAAAIRWDRALLVPLLLSGLIVLGPVVGFHTGWLRAFVWEDQERDIRVVSLNAEGGRLWALEVNSLIYDWEVDIAAFQECRGPLQEALTWLGEDWYTDARSGFCLVSRFEIVETLEMDREAFQFAGGGAVIATYLLDVHGELVRLTNVHLETPRAGLELILAGRLGEGILKLGERSALREVELRRAREWVDQFSGPQIVVGDFNTPPESPIYRGPWSDWQNAFSLMGRGVGGTRMNGWIRVRIDHILASEHWQVVSSRVADDVGSDHRPILASVRRR